MATKLNSQYGYSYDNLKVLLGGWNSWKAAGYPTEGSVNAPPAGGGSVSGTPLPIDGGAGGVIQVTPPAP